MLRTFSLISLLILLAAPVAAYGADGGVMGRVVQGSDGSAGVYVEAFRDPGAAGSPVAATNTGADGLFRLELPAGVYFLTAKKRPGAASSGGMLYGTSGLAGVTVSKGWTPVEDIHLKDRGSTGYPTEGGLQVSGRVLYEGKAAPGSHVYLYPGQVRRGPGYEARVRCGTDGRFATRLMPGLYTVTVRQGQGADGIGSVQEGDLVGDYPGNPLSLGSADQDLGDIPLRRVDSDLLRERQWGGDSGSLKLSGLITDEGGRPVAGVYAFLYSDHRMVGKPVAISAPTGPDGRYELTVTEKGAYYLGARSRFGGPVEPGEFMGAFGGSSIQPVQIGPGGPQVLDFQVREVW